MKLDYYANDNNMTLSIGTRYFILWHYARTILVINNNIIISLIVLITNKLVIRSIRLYALSLSLVGCVQTSVLSVKQYYEIYFYS